MADLRSFATKEKSEEGVIFPVKIGSTKYPMAIQIFGSDSDLVKEFERERIRKIGLGKKGKNELDEDTIEELLETQDEAILIRMGEMYSYDWKKKECTDEPLTFGEIVLKNDRKSKEIIIENIPDIKDFVTEKSNERSNFLSEGKKN